MLPFAFALASLRETKLFPGVLARRTLPFPALMVFCQHLYSSSEYKNFLSWRHLLVTAQLHRDVPVPVRESSHVAIAAKAATFLETLLFGAVSSPGALDEGAAANWAPVPS